MISRVDAARRVSRTTERMKSTPRDHMAPLSSSRPQARTSVLRACFPSNTPRGNAGVGHLELLTVPSSRALIASQVESGETSSGSPWQTEVEPVPTLRPTLPQITIDVFLQFSPWIGGMAYPDSGPVCARRSHRPKHRRTSLRASVSSDRSALYHPQGRQTHAYIRPQDRTARRAHADAPSAWYDAPDQESPEGMRRSSKAGVLRLSNV